MWKGFFSLSLKLEDSKGLEHCQILVSARVVEPVPYGYKKLATVNIYGVKSYTKNFYCVWGAGGDLIPLLFKGQLHVSGISTRSLKSHKYFWGQSFQEFEGLDKKWVRNRSWYQEPVKFQQINKLSNIKERWEKELRTLDTKEWLS